MQIIVQPTPGMVNENIDDRVAALLQAGANITLNYDDTANTLTIVGSTSAAGAPLGAEYITSVADATLSAERVLTDTATITWDRATVGQIKANASITSYTDEQAQDAVGTILVNSATISFTYNDTTPSITADLILPAQPYDLGLTWAGTLPASQVMLRYPFPRAVTFPSGLTNSRGVAGAAATGAKVIDLRKNNVSFGSINFAAGATTATFTMASATSFASGDVLTAIAPASADATLADLGISLAGTR